MLQRGWHAFSSDLEIRLGVDRGNIGVDLGRRATRPTEVRRDKSRSLRTARGSGLEQSLFGVADHEGPGLGVDRVQ